MGNPDRNKEIEFWKIEGPRRKECRDKHGILEVYPGTEEAWNKIIADVMAKLKAERGEAWKSVHNVFECATVQPQLTILILLLVLYGSDLVSFVSELKGALQ